MRNLKKFFIISGLFILLFINNVHAADGINKAMGNALGDKGVARVSYKDVSVDSIIGKIISVVLSFLGTIFIILTIYAGFTWMMAQGNDEKVKKAQDILRMSIIGLVIVVGAYAISYLVMSNLADTTLN